jgi:cell division septal protein FtsQ
MQALLDTVSLGAIRDRLAGDPYIRTARVSRTFPGTVTIDIEERIPVASFNINGQIRYIDVEGVVLPPMKSDARFDLPFVSGIPALRKARVGVTVESDDYFEAIALLDAALATDSSIYRLISEVDMNGGGDIIIHSVDLAVPIMFGRGDAPAKFALLRSFWAKFVLDEGPEKLDYLDLRFSDQVVAKWNNKPRRTFNQSSL